MPDFDPGEPAPTLTRGYVLGLLGGAVLLALYCLLNILADPSGEFGFSGQFVFNRTPPNAAILQGQAGGNPMFYARAIRESRANIYLFGPSRTDRGFDTCSRPNILRIAADAWELAQLSQLQALVLGSKKHAVTLLIEIGLPQDERGRVALRRGELVSAALSPENALFSVQTVSASLIGHAPPPVYTRCAPRPSDQPDWNGALEKLRTTQKFVDASHESLLHGRDNLMAMADAADLICARTGIRHRLIYFSLPATPTQSPGQKLNALIQSNSQAIAELFTRRAKTSNGCDIRYLNFTQAPPGDIAERSLWGARDQWFDYVHYSPRLGSIALRVLLDTSVFRAPKNQTRHVGRLAPSLSATRPIE